MFAPPFFENSAHCIYDFLLVDESSSQFKNKTKTKWFWLFSTIFRGKICYDLYLFIPLFRDSAPCTCALTKPGNLVKWNWNMCFSIFFSAIKILLWLAFLPCVPLRRDGAPPPSFLNIAKTELCKKKTQKQT